MVTDSDAPGIDFKILRQLEASVGRDVLEMLVAEFLAGVDDRLDRIASAAETRDAEVLIRQAHDLSSEAGALGLSALYDAAKRLEVAGKSGDLDGAVSTARGMSAVASPPLAALRTMFPPIAA